MIILTVQTIKCTGMIEYCQIPVAMLWPFRNRIFWISAAGTAGAYKITDTICRKGIEVVIQVSLVRPSSANFSVLYSPKTAKTCSPVRNSASVKAQSAGNAVCCTGGLLRKAVCPSTVLVNLFNLRPDKLEMGPYTVGTKADGI